MKAAVAAVSIGAALSMGVGTASAATYETLEVATPRDNTVVFTVTNTDIDPASCQAYGQGPVYFQTGHFRVPPRGSTKVTVADVPSGNYTIGWSCLFAHEKHLITVGGTPTPSAKPHVVPNDSIPTIPGLPAELSSLIEPIIDALLSAAGSSA